jgi:hypothetical protein
MAMMILARATSVVITQKIIVVLESFVVSVVIVIEVLECMVLNLAADWLNKAGGAGYEGNDFTPDKRLL